MLGTGNKPNKLSPISDQKLDMLYEKEILGSRNTKAQMNKFRSTTVLFGHRGIKENYNLRYSKIIHKNTKL